MGKIFLLWSGRLILTFGIVLLIAGTYIRRMPNREAFIARHGFGESTVMTIFIVALASIGIAMLTEKLCGNEKQ